MSGSSASAKSRQLELREPMGSISAHVFGIDEECVVTRVELSRPVFSKVDCFIFLLVCVITDVTPLTFCLIV